MSVNDFILGDVDSNGVEELIAVDDYPENQVLILDISSELKADLVVNQVDLPEGVHWGDSGINVSWTVTNSGDGTALADWYDGIYLSDDSTFDSDDTLLDDQRVGNESPLAPDGSYTAQRTIYIPSNDVGQPYLFVVADYLNNELESDESNNATSASNLITMPDVDLVVSDVTIPERVTWGQSGVDISWKVTNLGLDESRNSWYDVIYLSNDSEFDSSDTRIASKWNSSRLSYKESYDVSTKIRIPSGYREIGKPYLFVVADAYNWQIESNESNNAALASNLITYPDLVVTEVTIPEDLDWGQQGVDVTWEVKNEGPGNAVGSWYDGIYVSSDPVFDSSDDDYVSRVYIRNEFLNPEERYTQSQTIDIPVGNGSDEKPYLFVVTDYRNNRPESNETNNVTGDPNVIADPDLAITKAEVLSSPIIGGEVELKWEVTNSGDGSALSDWTDAVYLSEDDILDPDELLATVVRNQLEAKGTYEENLTITLPAAVDSLSQRLFFVIDEKNNQAELNETNNLASLAIDIAVPDLTISATAPEQIYLNEEFVLDWTVNNPTSVPALANWTDAVYLSDDQILDGNDFQLLSTNSLGQTYENSQPITIPAIIVLAISICW